MRIQLTRSTVKALEALLQKMVKFGQAKLVRRISALLEHLHQHLKVEEVAHKWGVSQAAIYHWIKQFMCKGVASLHYNYKGCRPPKLSLRQQKTLTELLDSGPQGCGFEEGCWNSALVQQLIKLKFEVEYHVQYVSALLHKLGYSFQKAERIADYLDPQHRQEWCEETWPNLLAEAKRVKGLILFEDEASFAQWGSLGYTWARVGQTPQVKTSGKRKGYKVFGAVEYFTGRVFYKGIEGKFNSTSYQAFLEEVLEKTTEVIFLVQDGARYHTSKEIKEFFEEQRERLRVYQLPAYSPDYNPIEYLWRKTKRKGTHNKYFAEFGLLAEAVDQALAGFEQKPQEILGLFGCYHKDQSEPEQVAA